MAAAFEEAIREHRKFGMGNARSDRFRINTSQAREAHVGARQLSPGDGPGGCLGSLLVGRGSARHGAPRTGQEGQAERLVAHCGALARPRLDCLAGRARPKALAAETGQ